MNDSLLNTPILQSFTLTELSVAVGTILGSLTACLLVCFKSRCKSLKCFGFSCDRELIDERKNEKDIELQPEQTIF